MLNSELHKTSHVLYPDLVHQTTTVGIDGFGGDGKSLGDLLAGPTLCHKLQDLAFRGD